MRILQTPPSIAIGILQKKYYQLTIETSPLQASHTVAQRDPTTWLEKEASLSSQMFLFKVLLRHRYKRGCRRVTAA